MRRWPRPIADLGRVRRDSLVEDPFCGSGTLLIEAAQKAMNIAPGLKRRFAAERYSFVPASLWAEQRQKALAESKLDVGFEAFGYDIDPAAVALANANAKLAGVEKRCHFEVADVADFAAKPEAIVLTNPPYGERMSTIEVPPSWPAPWASRWPNIPARACTQSLPIWSLRATTASAPTSAARCTTV